MVVWVTAVMKRGIPFFEIVVEHQVQLQMHMRAFSINPDAGITHDGDVLPALHRFAGADVDLT